MLAGLKPSVTGRRQAVVKVEDGMDVKMYCCLSYPAGQAKQPAKIIIIVKKAQIITCQSHYRILYVCVYTYIFYFLKSPFTLRGMMLGP